MKPETQHIVAGFIKGMQADTCGWDEEVIGQFAYEVYRLIESPMEIPDK